MTADTKTPLEHVNDTVLQLKEMRHYSKNNVELLTTQWLMFDGELSKLKQAGTIEDLMTRQSQFYDALEGAIDDEHERRERERKDGELHDAVRPSPPPLEIGERPAEEGEHVEVGKVRADGARAL